MKLLFRLPSSHESCLRYLVLLLGQIPCSQKAAAKSVFAIHFFDFVVLSVASPLSMKSFLVFGFVCFFSAACASLCLLSFLKTAAYAFFQPIMPSLSPSFRQAACQLSVPLFLSFAIACSRNSWFGDVDSIAGIPSPLSFLLTFCFWCFHVLPL